MENHSNKVMDVTGDVIHELAIRYNTTLREINSLVGDRVYAIVCDCSKQLINKEQVQGDLFSN